MKQIVTYIVTGRVQGVGYRYFVREQARIIGICGYTKNLNDGSVKVCCELETEQIQLFRDVLFHNCSRASVDNITFTIESDSSDFFDFNIY